EHLPAVGSLVDGGAGRLLPGLLIPAGEVPLGGAKDDERGTAGELSPALRIALLALGIIPEERRRAMVGERVAPRRLRHFLHALDERVHGLGKPGAGVLLDPVTGNGGVLDGSEIGLPQLGDGVLAAGSGSALRIRKRDLHEVEQFLGGEAALAGDGADAVAVQAEAQAPFARRLAVDGLPFEIERSRLDRDR